MSQTPHRTVLIIDDSLTVRMDLAAAFEGAGFVAVPCGSAAAAREALTHTLADVIVLDVLLPDADGVELLGELRSIANAAAAPILMLSTEAEVKDRIRGLQTGADVYIGKPYDTRYVIAKTQELLRARRLSGTTAAEPTTVLIIGDSATFREALRAAFDADGYRVLTAVDGHEGLRIASTARPDGVIVDGVLPDIDGATVIRSLRLDAALRSTPCLLLTASEDSAAELIALDAGADAFARKSEDTSVVLAKFRALLRQVGPIAATSGESWSLLGPKKILAVDDSPTFLNEIASQLHTAGYDIVMARSGEEALELLAVEQVDCILLDLLMPGLGGQETCRRIKAVPATRDIPLIMLTSLEDRAVMIDSLGAGADDYISKSSEFEVLAARVRAQLRRKQFEDEHRRIRDELLHKEIEATEARAAVQLAETRADLIGELERKNTELEAFSYSVSHDLRAPLRSINGFSQALLEDHAAALDERGKDSLRRVCAAALRMGELIDDMLHLSRVGRADLHREHVDVSALVHVILADLAKQDPQRQVAVNVTDGVSVDADRRLIRIALENLLGNAWKFTAKTDAARISFGSSGDGAQVVCFVSDNGDGFNMQYSDRLFQPFQRLHADTDFAGTGIGLATVHRIVERHGGRVWADAEAGKGATFSFTVPTAQRASGR